MVSWSYTTHGVTLSDPKLSLTALLLLLQVKAPNAALKEQIPGKKWSGKEQKTCWDNSLGVNSSLRLDSQLDVDVLGGPAPPAWVCGLLKAQLEKPKIPSGNVHLGGEGVEGWGWEPAMQLCGKCNASPPERTAVQP